MTKENLKATVKEKLLMHGILIIGLLFIFKFRGPIYDFMWTDKYFFRPAVEKSVETTYDNLDKVIVPVGKKVVNEMIKFGEFLDEIPPRF